MYPSSLSIPASDVRAALQLLNELRELPDAVARKKHLLRRLCELLGGKAGAISFLRDTGPGWQFQPISCCDYGWQCPSERAAITSFRAEDLVGVEACHVVGSRNDSDPMDRMLGLPDAVNTFRRDDLHDRRAWYATGNVNEIRRPGGIDDCVYSLHRLPMPGWTVGVGVHRAWGERVPFSRRDRALLHLLNEQLRWMWQQDAAACACGGDGCSTRGDGAELPPRLRQTLGLLLEGRSEKEAARMLGLSPTTLHKYVTALYRHFAVSSRAELLACRLREK